jgi:hypothetical protein
MPVNKGVIPSPVICGNCKNHDPFWRCPQQLHSHLCTSFEARDPGDIEVEEEAPYQREPLGLPVEGEKPPSERFDFMEDDKVEEEEEPDG